MAGKITLDRAWIGAPAGTLANPTVWLFVLALGLLALGTWHWAAGAWPAAAVIPLHTLALYLVFTPLHESMHGVAHRRDAVNDGIGRVAGALLTIPLPLFRAVHFEHHSHTNDPARDPDHVVARAPRWLLPLWCVAVVAEYRRHFYGRRLWRNAADLRRAAAYDLGLATLLASAFAFGFGRALLVLWIAPALLAVLVLGLFFDFVPHYPYDTRARYYDTRIYGGALLDAALLGQNRHLIHHLWTTIPWFRYRRVFATIRAELMAHGCRIGWRVTPLPASVDHRAA